MAKNNRSAMPVDHTQRAAHQSVKEAGEKGHLVAKAYARNSERERLEFSGRTLRKSVRPVRSIRWLELTRLILRRHGGPVDTDDYEVYLPVLASELARYFAKYPDAAVAALLSLMPCVAVLDVEAALRAAYSSGKHLSAQEMGDAIVLTVAEREEEFITTIRPAGMSAAKFASYRRARNAARKRLKRGPGKREINLSEIARALGISRKTVQRAKSAGKLGDLIAKCPSSVRTKYIHMVGTKVGHPGSKGGGGRPPRPTPLQAMKLQMVVRKLNRRPPSFAINRTLKTAMHAAEATPAVVAKLLSNATAAIRRAA